MADRHDWWEFADGAQVRAAATASLRARGVPIVAPRFEGHCRKLGGCGICDQTVATIRKDAPAPPPPPPAPGEWPNHWEAAS